MGWNIDLQTDKPMTEMVIEEVIAELPASLQQGFGKQQWGWSLAVDVRLNNPRELGLSGSYGISGKIAECAAKEFAHRLEMRGFKVMCGEMS